jgi:hypothetical protein
MRGSWAGDPRRAGPGRVGNRVGAPGGRAERPAPASSAWPTCRVARSPCPNLGMLGVDYFDAILNIPQVAILAVGSTRQRQVWNDGDPAWAADLRNDPHLRPPRRRRCGWSGSGRDTSTAAGVHGVISAVHDRARGGVGARSAEGCRRVGWMGLAAPAPAVGTDRGIRAPGYPGAGLSECRGGRRSARVRAGGASGRRPIGGIPPGRPGARHCCPQRRATPADQ